MSATTAGVAPRVLLVEHEVGDRFRISVRGHSLVVDQPRSDGGEDSAPAPVELFVASLAACVAYYARRFLVRRGEAEQGLTVATEYQYASHPHRVGAIQLRIEVPGGLGPDEREALLSVASRCTVQSTLDHPPEVGIEIA